MAFLWNWALTALDYVGLAKKNARILILGLDNCGKTTLLHILRDDRIDFSGRHRISEEVVIGNVTFTAYDLGGHFAARRLWRDYYVNIDGIVFLVDAADQDRFDEAKHELIILLSDYQLIDLPFLILGNKIDKKKAVTKQTLAHSMGLIKMITSKQKLNCLVGGYLRSNILTQNEYKTSLNIIIAKYLQNVIEEPCKEIKKKAIKLFMCSIIKRVGYRDAFTWLSNNI
eukprot:553931_1